MIHSASAAPSTARGSSFASCFSWRVHLVEDRLRLARVAAGREHEEVRVDAHGSHVEDDDVFCQLLARESGDPACLIDRSQSTQCSHESGLSGVPVETELCDRAATAGTTSPSIDSPRRTRSRISDEETGYGSSSKISILGDVASGR